MYPNLGSSSELMMDFIKGPVFENTNPEGMIGSLKEIRLGPLKYSLIEVQKEFKSNIHLSTLTQKALNWS